MIKTTYLIEDELFSKFCFIGKTLGKSKNKIIAELLTDYVAKNLDKAKRIEELKQELEQVKTEIKG